MEAYVQAQTIEYQKHLTTTKDLESMIHHQQRLQDLRVIPNSYRPKLLQTNNTSLTEEFNKQYESLFMEHLNKVLTSNIISLQLQKATLISIITQTEQHLSSSSLPQKEIKKMYCKFLSENNIHQHTPIPALQAKLAEIPLPTTTPNPVHHRRRQKRKNSIPHPQPKKHTKSSHHFLSKGQTILHPPP